jgi:hypothetical protein
LLRELGSEAEALLAGGELAAGVVSETGGVALASVCVVLVGVVLVAVDVA